MLSKQSVTGNYQLKKYFPGFLMQTKKKLNTFLEPTVHNNLSF